MSIEEIIENYERYSFLHPNNRPSNLSDVIQKAVFLIGLETNPLLENSILLLKDCPPNISSRCLVGALKDSNSTQIVNDILRDYGASTYTCNPLVGALKNPEKVQPASDILKYYGASKHTCNPLIGALQNPNKVQPASDVLKCYGASKHTCPPLVAALESPNQVQPASNILKYYGASKETYRPLIISLQNSRKVKPASDILKCYGPSEGIIKYMNNCIRRDNKKHTRRIQDILRYYETQTNVESQK